jgi:gamma-glutamyl-gamma-aminobutyrate hydrolase PuuD
MSKRRRNKKRNKRKSNMRYINNSRFHLYNKSIYVVGGDKEYANWLPEMYHVDNVEDADLVMFTGGADVSPSYYNENRGTYTSINPSRDKEEIEIYKQAISLDKKIIGICRGSQLTCVMAGGRLIQHCTGHGIMGTHKIKWKSDEESDITSTHHQMQYPFDLPKEDYIMCAYSLSKKSDVYLDGDNNPIDIPKNFVEPEVVVYTKIDAIAIQGHPEYLDKEDEGVIKIKEVLNQFFIADFKNIIETV